MKRLLLITLAFTLSCVNLLAQVNFHEGYIITLQGDTVYGHIDYRSDARNAKQCLFLPRDSYDTKTYLPGEIQGYRFTFNGRYYVSMPIPKEGASDETEMVFLEYVVRGNLSFYYMGTVNSEIYYLEDETGRLAHFPNVDELAQPDTRRELLNEAFSLIYKSERAQKMLWGTQTNKVNVKDMVLRYNQDVCPDGQCEIFEFRLRKNLKEEKIKFITE